MKSAILCLIGILTLMFGLLFVSPSAQESDEIIDEDSTFQGNRAMEIADALQYDGGIVANIVFNNNKATINQELSTDIYDIVQVMNVNPALELTVACYTDQADRRLWN